MHGAKPKPTVGQSLPRAADAHTTPEKWRDWILADRGHGAEWARIFHVEVDDAERVWQAIVDAALHAPIVTLIGRGQLGVVCGLDIELTIGSRTARVRTSWHYGQVGDSLRLVTAYPRL
jgi:hypothetical protein